MKYSLRPSTKRCFRPTKQKAVAELEYEIAQPLDQSVLELALLDRSAYPQELQVVAALQCFFGLLGQMLGQCRREVVHLSFGQRAPMSIGLDLVEQHIAAPAEARAVAQVVQT